jgi:hypothetical protein
MVLCGQPIMSKLVFSVGLAITVLSVAFVSLDWMLTPLPGLTNSNVHRVLPGISRQQVERILGVPPNAEFNQRRTALWDNGKAVIIVEYDDEGRTLSAKMIPWDKQSEQSGLFDHLRRWFHR